MSKNFKNYKYTDYTTDDIVQFVRTCMCKGVAINYYNKENVNKFAIVIYPMTCSKINDETSEIYKHIVKNEAVQIIEFEKIRLDFRVKVTGVPLREVPRETMTKLYLEVCASIDSILLEVHGQDIDDELSSWIKSLNI